MPEGVEKVRYAPCATTASRYSKTMAQPDVGLYKHLRGTAIINGDQSMLAPKVRAFVEESVDLCQPENIHICDGTDDENVQLLHLMQRLGTIQPLPKYENCWLARTHPGDVARVEGKTFICTRDKREAIPTPKEGITGTLGNWLSIEDMKKAIQERFPGCMKGRTMYVIPFSMGPIGSPLAKIGVELTDSPYVVASMRVMTRMGKPVLDLLLKDEEFVKCLHSVGGTGEFKGWPCDPERTIILHRPETNDIVSFGSGYGGNSLLGKKCFALRIGSTIAKREGWLAEHMLILGITNPAGKKRYIAAAFPSACGKTNMAMMSPTLPGYKVECVGDDIAWMKFDSSGQLRAINPENGFFGVAPGTSMKTNPNAMRSMFKNSMFTNVAATSDGGVYWEGMDAESIEGLQITDWLGKPWTPSSDTPSSHPNSRFTAPITQCPILDPDFEKHEGVPIDAILFGGRRPTGVPLVYEAFNWTHGVFMGASVSSETTAAAEHKGRQIMHDPFAMRPFFGYNFGHYMEHWLSLQNREGVKLPRIYHVNWFRKDDKNKFLWPGFGDNTRVVDWILRRIDGEDVAIESPLGYIPKPDAMNLTALENIQYNQLFKIERGFWMKEVEEMEKYFSEQLPEDLPEPIRKELAALRKRIESL